MFSLDSIPEDQSVDTFNSFVSQNEKGVKKYHLFNTIFEKNKEYITKGIEIFNSEREYTPVYPARLLITFDIEGKVIAIEKKFVGKRYIISEVPEDLYNLFIDQNNYPLYQYAIEPKGDGGYAFKSVICRPEENPTTVVKEMFEKIIWAI